MGTYVPVEENHPARTGPSQTPSFPTATDTPSPEEGVTGKERQRKSRQGPSKLSRCVFPGVMEVVWAPQTDHPGLNPSDTL